MLLLVTGIAQMEGQACHVVSDYVPYAKLCLRNKQACPAYLCNYQLRQKLFYADLVFICAICGKAPHAKLSLAIMFLSYLITKENYKRTGKLVSSQYFTNAYGYEEHPLIEPPKRIHLPSISGPDWPVTDDKKLLPYIAKITGHYYNVQAGIVNMFYDKEKSEIVQVFKFD